MPTGASQCRRPLSSRLRPELGLLIHGLCFHRGYLSRHVHWCRPSYFFQSSILINLALWFSSSSLKPIPQRSNPAECERGNPERGFNFDLCVIAHTRVKGSSVQASRASLGVTLRNNRMNINHSTSLCPPSQEVL